jgi:hypothetical protein
LTILSSTNSFLGLDVGTGDLIINGKVKIKQGTEPDYFTDDALVFKDGSSLRADLVVFATGYEPIKSSVSDIFGEELAGKVTPVWSLDEEGENRRAYTPSGHPGVSTYPTCTARFTESYQLDSYGGP